jgi:hypothetical protein
VVASGKAPAVLGVDARELPQLTVYENGGAGKLLLEDARLRQSADRAALGRRAPARHRHRAREGDDDRGAGRRVRQRASHSFDPLWAPSGTLQATADDDGVHVRRPDGTDVRTLIGPRSCPSGRGPELASFPDGRSLVEDYVCAENDSELFTMPADGTGLRRLTDTIETETEPAWSPDGSSIAFSSADPGWPGLRLFAVSARGGRAQDLGPGYCPAWGPDQIVYPGQGGLWSTAPDGSGKHRIVKGNVGAPAWSRQGQLAYVDSDDEALVIADAEGHTIRRFELHLDELRDISWSPDSRQLILTAGAQGKIADLYTVDADGSHLRRVTTNQSACCPSWR